MENPIISNSKLKNLKDLENLLDSHRDKKFTNGFVYYLFLQLGKNASKTAEQIVKMAENNSHTTSVKTKISRMHDQVIQYKRNIHHHWNSIVDFFNSDFRFPERKNSLPCVQPKHPPSISPIKTRNDRDCHSCEYKRQANSELLAANKKLKLDKRFEVSEKLQLKKKYQVKRVNELIKRKTSRISSYKLKTKMLEEEVSTLQKSLRKLHMKCQFLVKENTKLKSEIATAERYTAELQLKIKSHEDDIENKIAA